MTVVDCYHLYSMRKDDDDVVVVGYDDGYYYTVHAGEAMKFGHRNVATDNYSVHDSDAVAFVVVAAVGKNAVSSLDDYYYYTNLWTCH